VPRHVFTAGLLALFALASGCSNGSPPVSATSVPLEAEAWDVHLDLTAFQDLPSSCFQGEALVLSPTPPASRDVRWAWVPGTPAELYVGRMRFVLGDTGAWDLPSTWRGNEGIFRATHVRSTLSQSGEQARGESTLVLHVEGDHLRGSLHLEATRSCTDRACAAATLRCEVSVGVSGQRLAPALVAAL
jgi:hypothetical protein